MQFRVFFAFSAVPHDYPGFWVLPSMIFADVLRSSEEWIFSGYGNNVIKRGNHNKSTGRESSQLSRGPLQRSAFQDLNQNVRFTIEHFQRSSVLMISGSTLNLAKIISPAFI